MGRDGNSTPTGEGTTRREALKLSGAAALGGVAAMLASGLVEAEPAGAATVPAHVPTSLRLSIDGSPVSHVLSMEVLESELSTATSEDATGAWTLVPTGLLTQRVSLTRRFSTASPLRAVYDTYKATQGKSGAVKNSRLVIEVRGRRGSTMNTFTLDGCWPVRWEGPTYDAATMAKGGGADQPTETIHFTYQKIEWT